MPNLALVDSSFASLYRNASFAAIVRDNVPLAGRPNQYGASAPAQQSVSIGAILPMLAGGAAEDSVVAGKT